MPIFTGSSEDGWDMREAQGAYVSPDGNEWSTLPYTLEQSYHQKEYDRETRMIQSLKPYIKCTKDLHTEYQKILDKKSNLSKSQRDWIVNRFKEPAIKEEKTADDHLAEMHEAYIEKVSESGMPHWMANLYAEQIWDSHPENPNNL